MHLCKDQDIKLQTWEYILAENETIILWKCTAQKWCHVSWNIQVLNENTFSPMYK